MNQTPDGGNVFQHDGTYNHKAMSRKSVKRRGLEY